MGKGAVIVARHGERIDYYLRDEGSNWLQNAERKWDPPLTHRGQMQARRLGTRLHKMIQQNDLPPIEAVYSSPLVRCCMTAGEAVIGYSAEANGVTLTEQEQKQEQKLQVIIEQGLVESLNDKWFRSWCLPDSDGSWGGPGGDTYQNGVFPPAIDESVVDERAKGPAHLLMHQSKEVSAFLSTYSGHAEDLSLSQMKDSSIAPEIQNSKEVSKLMKQDGHECIFSVEETDYKWGTFESRKGQQDRMEHVVNELTNKHPDGTILLVSHGGPVTHLYERLSGNDWEQHGVSSYASFSIYQTSQDGWKTLAVNDSIHVEEMHLESSDQTTSFV